MKQSKCFSTHYVNDSMVRDSTVHVGDKVHIRNVGFKGKIMLADKWARDTYIVINQPNSDIPVFQVTKESGNEKVKPYIEISCSLFLLSQECLSRAEPSQDNSFPR